jgi:phage terminase large subunit-like protein
LEGINKEVLELVRQLSPEKALSEACQRRFFRFVKTFWSVVVHEEPVWNWHIEFICDQLQELGFQLKERKKKEFDWVINVPPGSSKSTIVSIMFPAWLWTIDASLRIMSVSYADTLSKQLSMKSRDVIKSDLYRILFPEVQIKPDKDTQNQYENTQGGDRNATSVTGTVTGFHAHVILVDDPLNAKEALSEAGLKRANSFMKDTLPTRKVDKNVTVTVLIMQRLHTEDPSGKMLAKKKKIKHICIPGELNLGQKTNVHPPELADKYVNGLMDPNRLNKDNLEELLTDLGSYGYAGQIMQTPAPSDGGVWKKYIRPIKDADLDRMINYFNRYNKGEFSHQQEPTKPELSNFATDWDLAYTEKETNAASAFVSSFKWANKMVIDNFDYKYKEFPDLIAWMKLVNGPHYIEAKASGKSAVQTLWKSGVPAMEVEVTGGDKVGRTRMATPFAEAGLVYCRESILDRLYNDTKQGLLLFPNAQADVNDALTQGIQRILVQPDFFVV